MINIYNLYVMFVGEIMCLKKKYNFSISYCF